jgi:diaminopimelate decarboxylase
MKIIAGNPYLKKKGNKIFIDQVPFEQIIERSEFPLMIFLENRVRDNIKTFNRVFNKTFKNFQGFYSFKANFLPEICEIVLSEGLGAELIGLLELNLAIKLGFPSDKIIIGGPYLSKTLIEESIKNTVKEIIVYNINDIEKIDKIALRYHKIQNICLRTNSQKYESKLGTELNDKNLKKLASLIKRCKNVKMNTILSHYTTQMNTFEQYKKNISALARNFKKLYNEEIYIKNINLGGGFPEASVMNEIQLEKIANHMKKTLEIYDIKYENIYFEPGRYFIGDSGLLVTFITKANENRWIFLNIGNNICPKFAKCSLRFYNASKITHPHKYKTSIAGIMPTDQDVLAKNYFFTENLDEGDIILIANVGAYTLTFSNRFPYRLPKIILIKNKEINKIFDSKTDYDFSIRSFKS